MINREKVRQQYQKEIELFEKNNPKSKELFNKAQKNLLQGVPMNWMVKWAGSYPLSVVKAKGAHFIDADGHDIIDFCLGDTGAMTGHAPDKAIETIIERVRNGTTFMLPTEDAIFVGEELERRFGLPYWQFTLTATDANRFALRLARHITKRPKIIAYNWSYHGTVDETFATLNEDGTVGPRAGNIGPQVNPSLTTKIVEWNDIPALEEALKDGDVAAVIAEPVMTNIGIVHPERGYHDALRELTKKYETLLIIDETHTICTGIGGYTKAYNLKPDILTIGKPIASGIPAAVYGLSKEVAERVVYSMSKELSDTGGIGGTLAGNALSIAAIKATLSQVLTQEAYDVSIPLAEKFYRGVQSVIEEKGLPWNVTMLGNRVEYWFRKEPARNGSEAAAAYDFELDQYMHLASLNRGILMTPFHNMALIAPEATIEDIDKHTDVFREIVENILD